jgi:hypothetical protein
MTMKAVYTILLLFLSFQLYACNKGQQAQSESTTDTNLIQNPAPMKLKITIGSNTATANLYDNPTSRDFASLLPLSLTLEDYNGTEKISNLSRKLAAKDAPAGFDPSTGDITYYAPWGNLALFYKDFSYSTGLISLGKITSGIDALKVSGQVAVKIELEK